MVERSAQWSPAHRAESMVRLWPSPGQQVTSQSRMWKIITENVCEVIDCDWILRLFLSTFSLQVSKLTWTVNEDIALENCLKFTTFSFFSVLGFWLSHFNGYHQPERLNIWLSGQPALAHCSPGVSRVKSNSDEWILSELEPGDRLNTWKEFSHLATSD